MNRYKMLNCVVPKNIHTHPKGGIVGGMGGGAQKPKLDFPERFVEEVFECFLGQCI